MINFIYMAFILTPENSDIAVAVVMQGQESPGAKVSTHCIYVDCRGKIP